ncbi:phage repressor protein CI [Atlantibacter hermannii]|uniref:phage repressor protein CI n=1 Tax=Atlantibacter hermannii TaxID=565 RepID=UPI003A8FF047
MATYGFKQQKELAEHLGIHGNNVSSWLARNSIPSSVLLECALDTGVDVHWLVYGEFANASFKAGMDVPKGKALYDEVMSNGGKAVLRRIMDAYGFNTQKQLCDLLDISSGTVSTWVRREYFPGDVVVTCALDTGVSLQWLATGKGHIKNEEKKEVGKNDLEKRSLVGGVLLDADTISFDLSFLPIDIVKPVFINSTSKSWVIDANTRDISNGRWLMAINDKYDVYDIALLPGHKINVTNGSFNFICGVDEVNAAGKVVLTIDNNLQ